MVLFFSYQSHLWNSGIIFKKKNPEEKLKIHFILISGFLVVAHVAMVFGMVNPEIISKMPSMQKSM